MAVVSKRPLVVAIGVVIVVMGLVVAADLFLAFERPPQPLRLGTIQWLGEVGGTVDRVERLGRLGTGANARRAHGEFYVVHARIVAPLGLRPTWHDRDVEVRTFSGNGGTMRGLSFAVDEAAQKILDRQTGRPGPEHLIRGAVQHEDLVFDLPRDVEQPGLIFIPANDPVGGILDTLFGRFWQPHRFNLRYD